MSLPVVDGFEATDDLSHLDEKELAHHIINGTIWLAQKRGVTIESLLRDILGAHIVAKELAKLAESGRFDGFA